MIRWDFYLHVAACAALGIGIAWVIIFMFGCTPEEPEGTDWHVMCDKANWQEGCDEHTEGPVIVWEDDDQFDTFLSVNNEGELWINPKYTEDEIAARFWLSMTEKWSEFRYPLCTRVCAELYEAVEGFCDAD